MSRTKPRRTDADESQPVCPCGKPTYHKTGLCGDCRRTRCPDCDREFSNRNGLSRYCSECVRRRARAAQKYDMDFGGDGNDQARARVDSQGRGTT